MNHAETCASPHPCLTCKAPTKSGHVWPPYGDARSGRVPAERARIGVRSCCRSRSEPAAPTRHRSPGSAPRYRRREAAAERRGVGDQVWLVEALPVGGGEVGPVVAAADEREERLRLTSGDAGPGHVGGVDVEDVVVVARSRCPIRTLTDRNVRSTGRRRCWRRCRTPKLARDRPAGTGCGRSWCSPEPGLAGDQNALSVADCRSARPRSARTSTGTPAGIGDAGVVVLAVNASPIEPQLYWVLRLPPSNCAVT